MDDYFIMVDFPNYRSLWILLFYEAVGLLLLFKEHPVCLYPSQKNPQKQNKNPTQKTLRQSDELFFFKKLPLLLGAFLGDLSVCALFCVR